MSEIFNIYCDESCHLENDRQKAMVLGAVWCPLDKTTGDCRAAYGNSRESMTMPASFEVKWTKVSPGGKELLP